MGLKYSEDALGGSAVGGEVRAQRRAFVPEHGAALDFDDEFLRRQPTQRLIGVTGTEIEAPLQRGEIDVPIRCGIE